jgi:DMSO/TMAO reductase YedYZ molybdopterin-dependent catalytic subunit
MSTDAGSGRPVTRGFTGRPRGGGGADRLPPGQYLVEDFPVLSAGPTPYVDLDDWDFSVMAEDGRRLARWTWEEFRALPHETVTCDIHCVTKWSKLDTEWTGVSIDAVLEDLDVDAPYALVFADGDYTTNLPVADITDGQAWVATGYDGDDLEAEHGGPARLLVPHLYFWKSAKWVRGIRLLDEDDPGFWEALGYNNYGDPWREQRYWGD